MGAFQITYDDFTGGHYMGDRTNNQPANTWKGTDVILSARGDLMPVSPTLFYSKPSSVSSITEATIADVWLLGGRAYVFASWKGATTQSICFTGSMDAKPAIPLGTMVSLTGRPVGRVAYDGTNECFYYASTGTIYKFVVSTLTESTLSSTLAGSTGPTNCVISGYRILAYSTTQKKLWYSSNTRASFSTTDYYEFPGNITAVYPRANDVLVVTTEGTYSMVGVPGASVTIQRLLEASDTKEGMVRGAVVGRSLVFTDSSVSGQIDGSLYELSGATVRQVASFDSEVVISNLQNNAENTIVQNIGNSGVAVSFATGETYATNPNNTWSRFSGTATTNTAALRKAISRSGNNTRNEYFVIAQMESNVLQVYRVPYHLVIPVAETYKFNAPTPQDSIASSPVGYVSLSEYWHQKPFVVKEVMVEWIIDDPTYTGLTGTIGIGSSVTPLGCVDVTPANVPNLTVATASTSVTGSTLTTGFPIRVISRLRADNANKGYGASIQMTLTGCRLRRVVVTCED